jgi:xylose isomerase
LKTGRCHTLRADGIGAENEAGKHDFESLEKHILAKGDITPNKSGRQEAFENLVNRFVL